MHRNLNVLVANNQEKQKKVNTLEKLIERLKIPNKDVSVMSNTRLSWTSNIGISFAGNIEGKLESIAERIEENDQKFQDESLYTKNLTQMLHEEREAALVFKERTLEIEKITKQMTPQYEGLLRAKNVAVTFETRTSNELVHFNARVRENRNEFTRKFKQKRLELIGRENDIKEIVERIGKRLIVQKVNFN